MIKSEEEDLKNDINADIKTNQDTTKSDKEKVLVQSFKTEHDNESDSDFDYNSFVKCEIQEEVGHSEVNFDFDKDGIKQEIINTEALEMNIGLSNIR